MSFVAWFGWFALALFAAPVALAIWFEIEQCREAARKRKARLNARLAEDREVAWLDELYSLPTREHA